jgi:glyoxylase-like metal-dependent hydrolase (beta-lactamase superfamily II)
MFHLHARRSCRTFAGAVAALLLTAGTAAQNAAQEPLIKQDAARKVSEHVYVILDDNVGFVPNVGLVVGDDATLIVDTGLGERNGAVVLAEARKLGDNVQFYLTATHFHPEHDLGATAFPGSARMLRWQAQQAEVNAAGAQTIERFKGISPVVARFLEGARFRAVDTLFDDELTLDLGGVKVRLKGVGPNHTLGDTVMFVEQDRVLFTGDTVMSVFPAVSGASGSIDKWLGNLAEYASLSPAVVVPAHGRLGDGALIRRYEEYFRAVRTRTRMAKGDGQSVEETQRALAPALLQEFADLSPASGPATGRVNAAIQAAYREAP